MARGAQRDPLSVYYDLTVRRTLVAAIRQHQRNPLRPRAARIWVHSTPAQYRDPDAGGLTVTERAFTRSVYYQTDKAGEKVWSARLDWGGVERRAGGWARVLRVRLFTAKSGSSYAQRLPVSGSWQQSEERSYVSTGGRMPEQWMRRRSG